MRAQEVRRPRRPLPLPEVLGFGLVEVMARLTVLPGFLESITRGRFRQVIPLSTSGGSSTKSFRYLTISATTSEQSNARTPPTVDSNDAKKTGESDKTESEKSLFAEGIGDPLVCPLAINAREFHPGISFRIWIRQIMENPVTWLSLLLLILTGGGLIVYYDREKKQHIEELKARSSVVKPGPSAGTAAIGGPFKLVNHVGKPVTEKDFLGKWMLIYFGFTHCPDICPDELQKMAAAVDKIKEKARIEIVPVFISVDPERDTVEQVHDYVKEFHPDLIGLTGTPNEIRQVTRAYRVYYMKTEEEGSDYLVDHSIVMYLMNPKMDFVKFFGKNYDADALTEGIIKEIKGSN